MEWKRNGVQGCQCLSDSAGRAETRTRFKLVSASASGTPGLWSLEVLSPQFKFLFLCSSRPGLIRPEGLSLFGCQYSRGTFIATLALFFSQALATLYPIPP